MKKSYLDITYVLTFLLAWLALPACGQSLVKSLDFRPPGVQNQVGFDYRIGVVESTGLVYIGSTGAYGEEVGVIDPKKSSLVAVIPVPTEGQPFNLVRANQATQLVYLRIANSNRIAVVDGRASSHTFHKALLPLTFSNYVQSFAIDESAGLMYVTVLYYGDETHPLQSWVAIVDVNPGSATFHQIQEVSLGTDIVARGVAVNPVTHKAYIATAGVAPGVYVLQGTTLTLIPGTVGSFGVIVNEATNLIYATASGNQLNVIDGTNDSLVTVIGMPYNTQSGNYDLRMAVNRVTGRVYVRSNDPPAADKLMVVDGQRLSLTFNAVLASIAVGRRGNTVAVDESLNRIVTNSYVDLRTFIVDGSTNTVMRTIPSKQIPSDLALNRATHQVYVGNQPNFVQVIDLANNRLKATVTTATELGFAVVNPADHNLYLPVTADSVTMRTVDKAGRLGTVIGFPTTAGRAFFMALNRNTNRLYVQNTGANVSGDAMLPGFVSVISGKKVIANIVAGNQPFGLAVNETTNKIYSLDAGLPPPFPRSITVIDGWTNSTTTADTSAYPPSRQLQGIAAVNENTNKLYFWDGYGMGVLDGYTNVATPLPDSLAPVANFVVSKALNRIYVASRDTNLLHVLDGASDTEIATLNIDTPEAMAVNETTGRIYVANEASGTVTVVDGATNTIVRTITVGASPGSLAVNELTNRVYVYNDNVPSISFIDGARNAVAATVLLPSIPMTNRAVQVVADPGVSRVYAVENDGNGQLFVLSDTAGTLTALQQAIASATDPVVRKNMLAELKGADTALAQGNTAVGVTALKSLDNEVQFQHGKAFTSAAAERIRALIDAVIASVN